MELKKNILMQLADIHIVYMKCIILIYIYKDVRVRAGNIQMFYTQRSTAWCLLSYAKHWAPLSFLLIHLFYFLFPGLKMYGWRNHWCPPFFPVFFPISLSLQWMGHFPLDQMKTRLIRSAQFESQIYQVSAFM